MPAAQAAPADPAMAPDQQAAQDQITQLKEQVVKLQGALKQKQGKAPMKNAKGMAGGGQPAMGMEGDSSEMGGMGAAAAPMARMQEDKGEMGGMGAAPMSKKPKGGMAPMQDDKPEMGGMPMKKGMPMPDSDCCGMGSMGKPMSGSASGGMAAKGSGMSAGSMSGKPAGSMAGGGSSANMAAGTPSLMHLGAKDFFLDHAQHLALTADQKASLESIKTKSEQERTTTQKQIAQAQQELWQLTGAAQPDSGQIDVKVQQIAKLRADEQMNYVHCVSEASKVLTPEQQQEVLKPMGRARKGPKAAMPASNQ